MNDKILSLDELKKLTKSKKPKIVADKIDYDKKQILSSMRDNIKNKDDWDIQPISTNIDSLVDVILNLISVVEVQRKEILDLVDYKIKEVNDRIDALPKPNLPTPGTP